MKKVQVKHIASFIGKVFGAPTAGADGKLALSEEQCAKIRETLGEEVLAAYKSTLAEEPEKEVDKEALEVILGAIDIDRDELKKSATDALAKVAALEAHIEKLQKSPESMPGATQVTSAPAPAFKANRTARHNAVVLAAMENHSMLSAADATMDIAELNSEFGAYLSQGNNIPILRSLYNSFESSKYMTKKLCVTEYRAVQAHITSVVKQFVPSWSKQGNSKFTPITIKNRHHKVNFSIIPAEVLGGWLMHLYDERKTIDEMPITKYIVDTILFPSILNDIEMFMVGKGKFVDHTSDPQNSNALNSMDGLETILVSDKTTGDYKINFYPDAKNLLSADMTDEAVVDYIDDFASNISGVYQAQRMNVFCSQSVLRRYERGYKKKWATGSGVADPKFGTRQIDFSNLTLVGLPALHGSPILFTTPKENLVMTVNFNEAPNIIKDVQKVDYEVKLFGEFWLGVGFAIGEAVFASVPDGYDPATTVDITDPLADSGKWVKGGAASTDAGESA